MKHLGLSLYTMLVLGLSSCGINNDNAQKSAQTTSTDTTPQQQSADIGLVAKMSIQDTVTIGESLELTFTVYNSADSIQKFCKWHTPFEPFISKYLEIRSDSGEEVDYKGAMAKRIMPPPAESYIAVNPKDSISTRVDILKGYQINKPAKYTIIYTGQNMSGLTVTDSISFIYAK